MDSILQKNQDYFRNKRPLGEILCGAKSGLELYTTAYGAVALDIVDYDNRLVCCATQDKYVWFDFEGHLDPSTDDSECVLFPSKDNRDWTTFELPKGSLEIGDYDKEEHGIFKSMTISKLPKGPLEIGDYVKEEHGIFKIMTISETHGDTWYYLDLVTKWDERYPVACLAEQLEKIDKFSYDYLRPWDKILSRLNDKDVWCADTYCNMTPHGHLTQLRTYRKSQYLPVNNETIWLLGTKESAPEFYSKAWEDR